MHRVAVAENQDARVFATPGGAGCEYVSEPVTARSSIDCRANRLHISFYLIDHAVNSRAVI